MLAATSSTLNLMISSYTFCLYVKFSLQGAIPRFGDHGGISKNRVVFWGTFALPKIL